MAIIHSTGAKLIQQKSVDIKSKASGGDALRYHVIPQETNKLKNLGKNVDTHVFQLRLLHDVIFK
jgi:hypothetical protein